MSRIAVGINSNRDDNFRGTESVATAIQLMKQNPEAVGEKFLQHHI
jgi:hypothetical protein